jgi:ParB family chromosome partitioning protein
MKTTSEPEARVQLIALAQIERDPGQPRALFDARALSELAASIRADGLLQPITVRRTGENSYMLVAGERRWRASKLNGASTIRALVIEPTDLADIRVKQIIENDQRVDVTPLEQARSYQALMDETGMTVEELAKRIGKHPHRITERTVLLRLPNEYQELLASGNLKPLEAYEMARLQPRGQALLFEAIKAGKCRTAADLRATAVAIANAESQVSFDMPGCAPEPTNEERDQMTAFENSVERIAAMLRTGISDNKVTAIRKVDPDKVDYYADLFAQMQKDLRRIELALREAAIQTTFALAR